jgi:hypothetical protein
VRNACWRDLENPVRKKSDETEDTTFEKEEKRKKARLRRRGPYRKTHANW